MKEKTYRRMTKKRSLRGLKLFKQKYLTKARLYALLAKIHLVREVKKILNYPYSESSEIRGIKCLREKIKTERGVFSLSYHTQSRQIINGLWYESLFKKKRLHTVIDEEYFSIEVRVHADCDTFLVKIDPFNKAWVKRNTPFIQVMKSPAIDVVGLAPDTIEEPTPTVTRINCDFIKARLGVQINTIVYHPEEVGTTIAELLTRAVKQLHDYADGHPDEINEKLTGVKYDGDFHTPDGKKLIPNCICHRCGRPVFESSVEGYTAQCIFCDEDLYGIEIDKIDPKRYEEIYDFNKYPLQKRLSE